jgi:hypothetical protein
MHLYNKKKQLLIVGLIFFTVILLTSPVTAKEDAQKLAILSGHGYVPEQLTVLFCEGPVYYRNFNENSWHKVQQHQSLMHGDYIRTGNHGYAVLAWSADNLILVKPKSGMRFAVNPEKIPQLLVQLQNATLMLVARESGFVEVEGKHCNLTVNHGETSIQSNDNHEIIKALKGQAACRVSGDSQPTVVPESYYLDISPEGATSPLAMFNPNKEYEYFKRFRNWLERFAQLHDSTSLETPFSVSSVKVNSKYLANLNINDKGMYELDSDDGKIVRTIHLQMKISPYPGPNDKFELYLGKNLVYALREGSQGNYEVKFAVPSFPDFLAAIHMVDSLGRKVRIFKAGFEVFNRRRKSEIARKFCRDLETAMKRRDHTWLRNHISREYNDWQGNTWFDFIKMSEDTLRNYRDVRLTLHPFRFEFYDNRILINLNYRLSALTANWNFRYEDRGSEIFTLVFEDGRWRLYAKVAGLFFARLKAAIDLRQGVIKGRVTDERTKRRLSGVSVKIRGTRYATTTNSMGEYTFYNIPPGDYDIQFAKNGFGELTATRITVKPSGEQF